MQVFISVSPNDLVAVYMQKIVLYRQKGQPKLMPFFEVHQTLNETVSLPAILQQTAQVQDFKRKQTSENLSRPAQTT